MFASAALLLAGCATNHDNTGAMGDQREVGTAASRDNDFESAPAPLPQGQNGSIGRGNPFGLGPGNTER
ncbi:MAG: hypothetical protein JWQ04_1673 [Pedosphaera sp.]|nr:hypothetical protein [Pedosphaera sp.]